MSRAACERGNPVAGPTLVVDDTSTIYIPAGWHGDSDENDNMIIRKAG